jgi:alkylhydroperoxidase/carboxymuconolactone decarboxylase family protein YurZ
MEKKNSYQIFMEEAPEAANAFNGLIGSLQNRGLDHKTMQLIYIGIKASQCGADAVAAHVPMAKQAGATWDEIKGAILMSLTVSGVSGVLSCLAPALSAYKELPSAPAQTGYDGKVFVSKSNSANGEVSEQTTFFYHQSGDVLWADYSGGGIVRGHLLGVVSSDGTLDFHYQHLNSDSQVRIGLCHSIPHVTDCGKLELHEEWQWLNGDKSTWVSVLIEQS